MQLAELDMTREEGVLAALLHRTRRIERALDAYPHDQIMQRHDRIARAHRDLALWRADVWCALRAAELADALDEADGLRHNAAAALIGHQAELAAAEIR